jgi:hypothetical protein
MKITIEDSAGNEKTFVAILLVKALLEAGFDVQLGTTGDLREALTMPIKGVSESCGKILVQTTQFPGPSPAQATSPLKPPYLTPGRQKKYLREWEDRSEKMVVYSEYNPQQVADALLEWYAEQGCYSGLALANMSVLHGTAVRVLGDIADKVFKFQQKSSWGRKSI